MHVLESISHGISSGSLSLEQINEAACDGIKNYYGITDLHFSRRYYTNPSVPSLGSTNDPNTGFYSSSDDNLSLSVGAPAHVSFAGLADDEYIQYLSSWACSRAIGKSSPISVDDLTKLLGDLSVGKGKIHFIDSGKDYDSLEELKQDNLVIRLSGI